MLLSSRFTAPAISVMVILVLSACQPTPDNDEIVADTPIISESSTTQADIDEGIKAGEVVNSTVNKRQMTEDYTKAMSRMNDEMMIGMAYNDPDTAFAKSMLGLHRGAVSMAELQLKYGTDSQMRLLAQEIINSQQQKIGIMNKWLASHPDVANPKPNTEAMQRAYADIVASMNYKIRLGTDALVADLAFARGMLPHQLAAVELAKAQLNYGTDEEMREFAELIINNQQPVIEQLQAWITMNDTALAEAENLEVENPEAAALTDTESGAVS